MDKKKTNYNVIFYFVENMKAKYIRDDDENNKLHEINITEINKPEHKLHSFSMLGSDYEKTHESLIQYKKDFNIEYEQLKTEWLVHEKTKKRFKLDYKKYFNHKDAVYQYFLSRINKSILDEFEPTTEDEFYIFEKCYNAGLITLNKDFKDKEIQCFGNDYSKYYPNLLLDIKIPQKAGVKSHLKNVEYGKLQFGIYRVKITYKDNRFTNIFNFSKHNHYNSTTLNYLYTIKDKFGLEFDLLEVDELNDYNALLYDDKYLLKGEKIFKNWFKSLTALLKEYPKNKLLKHLVSSLWGVIVSYKKVYLNDITEYDAEFNDSEEKSEYRILDMTDDGAYKCVKTLEPYNYNLSRIKPFLTSFARLKIMKVVLENNLLDNLVRIHTDCITTNIPYDYSTNCKSGYYPTKEDKTSGIMIYENALYGFHICQKCNERFKFKDFKNHKC
jgi:hypothetical protein